MCPVPSRFLFQTRVVKRVVNCIQLQSHLDSTKRLQRPDQDLYTSLQSKDLPSFFSPQAHLLPPRCLSSPPSSPLLSPPPGEQEVSLLRKTEAALRSSLTKMEALAVDNVELTRLLQKVLLWDVEA